MWVRYDPATMAPSTSHASSAAGVVSPAAACESPVLSPGSGGGGGGSGGSRWLQRTVVLNATTLQFYVTGRPDAAPTDPERSIPISSILGISIIGGRGRPTAGGGGGAGGGSSRLAAGGGGSGGSPTEEQCEFVVRYLRADYAPPTIYTSAPPHDSPSADAPPDSAFGATAGGKAARSEVQARVQLRVASRAELNNWILDLHLASARLLSSSARGSAGPVLTPTSASRVGLPLHVGTVPEEADVTGGEERGSRAAAHPPAGGATPAAARDSDSSDSDSEHVGGRATHMRKTSGAGGGARGREGGAGASDDEDDLVGRMEVALPVRASLTRTVPGLGRSSTPPTSALGMLARSGAAGIAAVSASPLRPSLITPAVAAAPAPAPAPAHPAPVASPGAVDGGDAASAAAPARAPLFFARQPSMGGGWRDRVKQSDRPAIPMPTEPPTLHDAHHRSTLHAASATPDWYSYCGTRGLRTRMEDVHLTIPDIAAAARAHHGHGSHHGHGHGHGHGSHGHGHSGHLHSASPPHVGGGDGGSGAAAAAGLPLTAMFAVFDGHAGVHVADLAAARLPGLVAGHPGFAEGGAAGMTAAMEGALATIDADFLAAFDAALVPRSEEMHAGSTACVATLRGRLLTVSNVGDSRAILCRAGVAVAASDEHTPAGDEVRILAAGGWVTHATEVHLPRGRQEDVDPFTRERVKQPVRMVQSSHVCGALGVSRALGDAAFKGGRHVSVADDWSWPEHTRRDITADLVVATPSTAVFDLLPTDDFLLLACDGVWEVLEPQEAVQVVLESLNAGGNATNAGSRLVKVALELGSEDNISVVVVVLRGRV